MGNFQVSFLSSLFIHCLAFLLVGFFAIRTPEYSQLVLTSVELVREEQQTAAGSGAYAAGNAMAQEHKHSGPAKAGEQPMPARENTRTNRSGPAPAPVASTQIEPARAGSLDGAGTKAENGLSGNSGESGNSEGGESPFTGGNFSRNADGSYTALNANGIQYTILRQIEPVYPAEARSVSYGKTVVVSARFVVGLDGGIEAIEILNNTPDLGFKEATRKALRQWRFAPIYFYGTNIKCTFIKDFYFSPR